MSSKSFGFREDGTLDFCRAKPENRGKGNCPHEEHRDISAEDLKAGFLARFNEKAVAKYVRESGLEALPTFVKEKKFKPVVFAYAPEELEASSNEVASSFKSEDFDFIKSFYERYQREMSDPEVQESFEANPAERIQRYLEGDDLAAVKLREHLGESADLRELSEILVEGVGSMTSSLRWDHRRVSAARSLLSTFKNDMTKSNYVASVLFFAGRCCYCNKPLSKQPKQPYAPSGEHITPISPADTESAVGGTRYGNMALACKRCNNDRGSKELTSWINSTSCIRKVEKANSLGRIKAFREFADYSEYSTEESNRLREAIGRIQAEVDKLRSSNGQIAPHSTAMIRSKVAQEIKKLSKET